MNYAELDIASRALELLHRETADLLHRLADPEEYATEQTRLEALREHLQGLIEEERKDRDQ